MPFLGTVRSFTHHGRTLRAVPGLDQRQPDLGSPPAVVSMTGFGSTGNAGAGIINNGSDADQSQGRVYIRTGLIGPFGPTGTLQLRFPIAPQANQYLIFAAWLASYGLVISTNNLIINWTAAQQFGPNELHYLNYQWAVSQ